MISLTVLTEIMGTDTEEAVARLRGLDIDQLDFKGAVFGRQIEDLDGVRRERLVELIDRSGLGVWCLSSCLGDANLDSVGEREFRTQLEWGIQNLQETISCVKPDLVRLLACALDAEEGDPADGMRDPVERIERLPPWVFDAYREAVDALALAGVRVTIENEPHSVLIDAAAVHAFFARLGRPLDQVGLTWDIQNMWAAGTFPTLAVYEQLRPLIDYVHLKGGRGSLVAPRTLLRRAPLEEAGWPVEQIVGQVLLDGVSPVLCINPSGPEDDSTFEVDDPGERWAREAIEDIEYLRRTFSQHGSRRHLTQRPVGAGGTEPGQRRDDDDSGAGRHA